MPTLDHKEHTLIGNFTVMIGGVDYTEYAEGLSCTTNTAGGFGTFSCKLRPPAVPPSYEDNIVVSGAISWQGKVTNSPDTPYREERESYEVVGEGPYREYGRESDFAIVLVDREYSNWQQIDCDDWGAADPAFTMSSDVSGRLRISGPDLDCLKSDFSAFDHDESHLYKYEGNEDPDAGVMTWALHQMYAGNPVPRPSALEMARRPHRRGMYIAKRGTYAADCPTPKALWSAIYYSVGDGITNDVITSFIFKARWNMSTPKMDGLTEENYRQPLGPWSETLRNRNSDYSKYNIWTWFYGTDKPPGDPNYPSPSEPFAEPPGCMYTGIYAIDDPASLPVKDPVAMFSHESMLMRFDRNDTHDGQTTFGEWDPVTGEVIIEPQRIDYTLHVPGTKFLVLYASYLPVQRPWAFGCFYDGPGRRFYDNQPEDYAVHDHKIRNNWRGTTMLWTEPEMFIELTDIAICCNEYGGESDAGKALKHIFPDANCDPFPIGLENPETHVWPKVSIIIPPYTTKLAAVQEIADLTKERICWGFWENGILWAKDNLGSVSVDPSEPGVTVNATRKQDGVVLTATVIFSDRTGNDDERVINAWAPKKITVDKDGSETESDYQSTVVDACGHVHDEDAAALAGVCVINKRGEGSWEGTIRLRSIDNAAGIRAGKIISGGQCDGALITSTNVDADADTVTLSLGGTGYVGRFAAIEGPGSEAPLSARTVMNYQLLSRRG